MSYTSVYSLQVKWRLLSLQCGWKESTASVRPELGGTVQPVSCFPAPEEYHSCLWKLRFQFIVRLTSGGTPSPSPFYFLNLFSSLPITDLFHKSLVCALLGVNLFLLPVLCPAVALKTQSIFHYFFPPHRNLILLKHAPFSIKREALHDENALKKSSWIVLFWWNYWKS